MGQPERRQGVLYLRKSKGRAGISRQRTTGKAHAARCGIEIIAEYVDVDRTAYQKVGGARPRRDGFTDMLAHLRRSGRDNPLTVIAWHADRLVRSDVDTHDLIEVCAAARHPVETVRGGGYELWTATGRKRIRGDANDAAYEVDHLIERLADMKAEAAREGRWLGGRRPFGFEADGVTVRDSEAREIARGTEALLSGVSVLSDVRDLNRRGVRTSTGAEWAMSQWRRVLMRPRNAGLMEWQGEVVGHAEWGQWMDERETIWGCIVGEDQWDALRRLLADPDRKTSPGPERRWLGSGLYACGVCGSTVICSMASGGPKQNRRRWHVYRCRGGVGSNPKGGKHVARNAAAVDELVVATLLEYLARPSSAALFNRPEADLAERQNLQRKLSWLRDRLDEQADLHAQGLIDTQQLAAGSARLRAELDAAKERVDQLSTTDVVGDLAGNRAVAEIWPTLPLSRRRAVVDATLKVTILPARLGRPAGAYPGDRYFDPSTVEIEFKAS